MCEIPFVRVKHMQSKPLMRRWSPQWCNPSSLALAAILKLIYGTVGKKMISPQAASPLCVLGPGSSQMPPGCGMWLEGRWRWAVSLDEGRTGRSSYAAPSSEWHFLAINRRISERIANCEIVRTIQMFFLINCRSFFFLQDYKDEKPLMKQVQKTRRCSLVLHLTRSRFVRAAADITEVF